MKFCISTIHLGRYKIELLDDYTNQVVMGYDGGSALVMIMLSKWMFEAEHAQYQRDQRASSDQLGKEAIKQIKQDMKEARNG